ncbi:uncharacterized protein P174DRAFT_453607 [Aspergillus novofumigatus IBT 16806]|uniref:Uncharacterized protein n=1 Tax=Aspergillus novofumigatus (strain IBT 16806) TaxID=1392255 RepID=A0A2I1BZ75_ASPN1|nr:uncharacterized protein P174DRAFT_453607 [Aspergillus novofumigatus IBT 16806]PKX90668.1 hypothetical protein P174DRAFT_453607 [Aspergillus novofumigatus IBT 16806]
MGHDVASLPERFRRVLGVPKLQSNLTPAHKLHVVELDGKWAVAKLEQEEVHKKRKAVEEDFPSLPFAKDDGRQGIYANFAPGDLQHKDEEYDGTKNCRKTGPFTWTKEAQEAFEELKNAFVDTPILAHFDPEKSAVSPPPVSPAASHLERSRPSSCRGVRAFLLGGRGPGVGVSEQPSAQHYVVPRQFDSRCQFGPSQLATGRPLRSDGSLGVLPPLGALPPLSPTAAGAEPLPAALPCQRCLKDALHQDRVCSCVRDTSYPLSPKE